MSSATPPLPAGSVNASAALRFSVDFDPSRADSKPSVLLLTQNIGGIEAALGTSAGLGETLPERPHSPMPENGGDISAAFASVPTFFGGPSYIHVPDDIDSELGVSPVVRQQVAEFLGDLRQWLHRLSYMSAAARAAEASATASSAAPASVAGGAASPPPSPTPCGAAANTEAYMRSYTPSVRPPLIDIVVLHFQEIGGKYKNKQFNEYFKEQIRTSLLPEAGWTSGLLMDERESGDTLSSSNYQRHRAASTVQALRRTSFEGSSSSNNNGSANGHAGDAHRLSDANSNDTDLTAELDAGADAYFTAIGSIVFLSPRVMGIASCLSVPHRTYIPIVDDPLTYAGEAGRLFHSGKFAEAGRSRKGFLLLSLRLGTVHFNVCNVHLFNDDDNRVALKSSPSLYTGRRARALKEAIAECSAVVDLSEPLFIFGDYNVRLDGKSFAEWVEEKMQMTVRAEKKRLRCPEQFWELFTDPATQQELRKRFDIEPQHLMDEVALLSSVELAEMPIQFAPTYSRVAYRTRTGATTTSAGADAAALRDVAATPDAQQQIPTSKDLAGRADAIRAEEQEQAEAIRVRPSLSTPLPSSMSPLASVPLTHVTASPHRDNFCHDRLPAWCDRVMFNVAGLEWISGDRSRTAPPQPHAASSVPGSAASGAGCLKGRQRSGQSCWYAYAAIDLIHTDHDGVFMLF
ncbi:inositol-145-trisphosphate (IP3) 5-phosphatase [Leishmania donovani]|uniref:Inositol-1_-4_-5-trisphosphate_(IP3)_5 -phosphatase_-_putative n=3 Tax=Leishmania donovani species complex TaxID=38574 RepID=A0A6L0WK61_LEIIN|nr:putative inositol-1,4,5-trisphosphate (IP3) 5-phosphatase [Leishmania infantum JPCM5]TPP39881.1 Endonuclease/Exonuclease/phosphatase family protein [Leishmania donovani]CAC9461263.1 inositol-1_-4_-5-trisphosphate_(IP3)_5 -phosphatase_-_putative [Leishmania infantum]CAJ1986928.1 inositol-145-trisphosphate (IP3) 5-phosphatase [Leishmania donovani]CAM66273.1 putative inositol-1,4,5-trisphosphate (IP3) 5-phosphatase [Leishmania infantum JPCM5]SUZ39882.1 inositol-1_-4_-5-trisphosphate_(IP3)_5 -p|eukprot:XP_001463901.1 putative inositol-1,4,5-trisphosphate (IP3) 5-phosphatase [Leishmania infantum JPCM5]